MLLINLSSSCQNENTNIEKADLTFRSISFASAYGASDEEYKLLLSQIDDSLSEKKNDEDENIKLLKYFNELRKYNLLRNPYIFLMLKDGSIITAYLSDKEYDKVKDIRHRDLIKEGKKAVVEIELIKKTENIYYSDNLIKIEKVEGKSRSNQ